MKAIPLGDKIVVKLFKEPKAYTAAKIMVVSHDEAAVRWGTVLEVGPDAFRVMPGQEVLVNTVFGKPFGEEDTLLLPDSACLLTRDVEMEPPTAPRVKHWRGKKIAAEDTETE